MTQDMRQTTGETAVGRIIRGEACIAEGAAWLVEKEPRFGPALALTGPLPLRLQPEGFSRLLQAIVSQQVSVASARAIWARLEQADLTSATRIAGQTPEYLREIGLSRQKATYALALAEAGIDFSELSNLTTPEVVRILTSVKGVGVWTAEIYAMFSLGRADVFAPGDLALQESARILFELPERPKEKALRQLAEDWSPWRAVAARALWAYYHVEKQREGIA